MSASSFTKSFRFRLIAPVAIAMAVAILSASSFIVFSQNRGNIHLSELITKAFQGTGTEINTSMTSLSRQFEEKLATMNSSARTILGESARDSLHKAAESMAYRMRKNYETSAESFAQLLAKVAQPAVIAHDSISLSSFARNAKSNPDIIFVFFMDETRQPLANYIFDGHKNMPALLQKTGRNPREIIKAAMADKNFQVISQVIGSEDEPAGYIYLALDTSKVQEENALLSTHFDKLIKENVDAIDQILAKESGTMIGALNSSIAEIQQQTAAAATVTATELSTSSKVLSKRLIIIFLFGSLFCFIIILAILLLNARVILRILGGEPADMARMAQRIAQGDLNIHFAGATAQAEGSLQGSLQQMVTKLQGLIRMLVSQSSQMADISTNLQKAAGETSRDAEVSASTTATVARSTIEMSDNMNTVALASDQAANNVNVVAMALTEMATAITTIAGNTEKANRITSEAVSYAESSTQKVNTLGEAANDISKVTEVITAISEQTYLLALNATIEAARAGDAGKGFAVVANEIKELAKQTAQATSEIKSKIDSIQNSTNETVADINMISKVIHDVNEIVSSISQAIEEQSATTAEITTNVSEATNGIASVSANIAGSSAAAAQIAQDINEVSQLASNSRECSGRVESGAQLLNKVVGELQLETAKFKLS